MDIGIPGFTSILPALFTPKIDAVVEDMLNHVRIWRSLHLYKSCLFEREARGKARPWIVDYLAEALGFFGQVGDCDPSVFELLVMYVHECKRPVRKHLQTLATILVIVLISPVMNASLLSFSIRMFPQLVLLGHVSSVAYGFVASKIALGGTRARFYPRSQL